METASNTSVSQAKESLGSALPLYNGFASVDDLRHATWPLEVAQLAARDLGGLGIDGWREHWSRVWEFPWAYRAILACARRTDCNDILESGCGVTPLPFWLGGDGFRVTGIDLDSSCERKWHLDGVPCRPDSSMTRFERGDMLNLPRADGSLELTYSISAVEHTVDPVKAVVEMLRVLKRGGYLVLTLDADVCGSDSVSWAAFADIQRLLGSSTSPVLPVRHLTPIRVLTFENRTIAPQSATRLLMKRVLDHFGVRQRKDHAIFAWAGVKL